MFEYLDSRRPRRAVLVGMAIPGISTEEARASLEELSQLAYTADIQVCEKVLQTRKNIDSTYYIGRGKAAELDALAQAHGVDLFIFDSVMLPRTMAECDVLISIPTFKLWMGKLPMTLSLKNLFGCFPARYYGHNAHSNELARTEPYRTLEGEVGTEPGVHIPSPEHNIAAINLARTSDIQVIDAIEGSDGKGNYVRMDTLIVGTNPVATDAVGLAVAGFVPEDQTQMQLCSQYGLGPSRLEEIEVVGESIESVHFRLQRIPENVRELPLAYCLDRLHIGEFDIIERGLRFYDFLAENDRLGEDRERATAKILEICGREDYLSRALETLPENARTVLRRIISMGGTSNSYFDVLNDYVEEFRESNSFWSGLRALMRLGLAFVFDGQYKPYIILAEGVTETAVRLGVAHEISEDTVRVG